MNTTTVSTARIASDSVFARFKRAFMAEFRKSLAVLGRSYGQGMRPF